VNLLEIVRRRPILEPWTEGEKIPWHEPAFSRRMLEEHLSQQHDLASRRFDRVDHHVNWIDREILSRRPSRVLDLGCGPGLYTERLSRLGHECVGIDYSPASIEYARERARLHQLRCGYLQEDIRTAPYGKDFDLALLVFGEFNVFSPEDGRGILERAHAALSHRGALLLEVHTVSAVREIGERGPSWYSADPGLFSDRPHLCLRESSWEPSGKTATERYFIVDAHTGVAARHGATVQAYSDAEYRSLLRDCGFARVDFFPSLTGRAEEVERHFFVIRAGIGDRSA
jgi:SAM-dependent methyltransferase